MNCTSQQTVFKRIWRVTSKANPGATAAEPNQIQIPVHLVNDGLMIILFDHPESGGQMRLPIPFAP
jgi:hypothetical protein